MNDSESDIQFLKQFNHELQDKYEVAQQLCDSDLQRVEGPVETPADAERCARLADKHGFNGNEFRWLFETELNGTIRSLRRQIEMIPRVIAVVEETTPAEPGPIFLDKYDKRILEFLETQKDPQKQYQIETNAKMTRKTISNHLKRLRDLGLAERPNGAHGGEVITPKGREMLRTHSVRKTASKDTHMK